MANHSDERFAFDYSVKNVRKEDYKGFDLCVLASSDHTVITYGTFSVWGALLSRGDVIAAKGTDNESYSSVRSKEHKYMYILTFRFLKSMITSI